MPMKQMIELNQLKPSDIVAVDMDEDKIFYIEVKKPVLNADLDHDVAAYIEAEQTRLEERHGYATGIFLDVSNYKRLDCVEIFGMTVPSPQARKVHAEACKKRTFKRLAFCKKGASSFMKLCVKMAALTTKNQEARVFSDRKSAIKWLKEGGAEDFSTK